MILFIALADLTKPLTLDECRTSIYNVMAATGVTTTGWKPGAVVRTMVTGFALIVASLTYMIAAIAKSGLLDFAESSWLTIKAFYDYNVERIPATYAEGVVTLVNSGGGVFNEVAEAVLFTNSATGKTYRNTQAISLGALSTLTDVPVRASEAGSASTALPLAIDTISSPVMLAVAVSNPSAIVGLDEESDVDLRTRCTEKTGALSPNGPSDAYAYVGRSVLLSGGGSAGVTRVTVARDGAGGVSVYCAGASGAITGSIGDLSTPLGAVDDAIQRKAVAIPATCDVLSAVTLAVPITYEVQLHNTSGQTDAQIQTAILASLASFMSVQPIGGNTISGPGKLFTSAIISAIGATKDSIGRPLPIFRVILTAPAADVSLTADQVPILGTVTCTAVRQVAPGNL